MKLDAVCRLLFLGPVVLALLVAIPLPLIAGCVRHAGPCPAACRDRHSGVPQFLLGCPVLMPMRIKERGR